MNFALGIGDILIMVIVIVGILLVGLYFLDKWASKKMTEQQTLMEQNKTNATIYVINKKKDKLTNVNLPKAVISQIPRTTKMMKLPLVKAKIGPQITTLMCDKKVYEALPVKKSVAVELSGMYIVSMKGMKSDAEMKRLKKKKKEKEKAAAKEAAKK